MVRRPDLETASSDGGEACVTDPQGLDSGPHALVEPLDESRSIIDQLLRWRPKLQMRRRIRSRSTKTAPSPQQDARAMRKPETTDGRESDRFLIAGVQMPVPIGGGNVAAMVAQVEKTMAIFPGVDMIVFSELAAHGPLHARASADPAADEGVFRVLAARHRVWLVPGSAFVRRHGATYNHAIVIAPDGSVAGRYDKMFPFTPFEADVAAGTDFLIFDVPEVGRFGLSI